SAQIAGYSAAGKPQLLEAAHDIAERLNHLAVADGNYASWVGPQMAGQSWTVSLAGRDLYGGASGIALFLGFCGELVNQGKYRILAKKALKSSVDRHWEEVARQTTTLPTGVLGGSGGLIYSLVKLGGLWKDEKLYDDALAIAKSVTAGTSQD